MLSFFFLSFLASSYLLLPLSHRNFCLFVSPISRNIKCYRLETLKQCAEWYRSTLEFSCLEIWRKIKIQPL